MPIYNFKCPKCGDKLEVLYKSLSLYEPSEVLKCKLETCGHEYVAGDNKIFAASTTVFFGEGFDTPSSFNMKGAAKMNQKKYKGQQNR